MANAEQINGDVLDDDAEELAGEFCDLILEHHHAILKGDDQEAKDAVVVKAVALVALAFGCPAVHGEPLNIPEAISKLQSALAVLKFKGLA